LSARPQRRAHSRGQAWLMIDQKNPFSRAHATAR
jgi:hypothetical protein